MESFSLMLLDMLWKSLPLFAAAGLFSHVLRRRSAAARHTLWLSVLVSLLCLPALCLWLPRRTLPLLPAAARPPRPAPPAQSLPMKILPATHPLPTKPSASTPPPPFADMNGRDPAPTLLPTPSKSRPAPIRQTDLAGWLTLLWLAGAGAALARTCLGLASARRLIRGCVPVPVGPLAEAADEARRALGLARPVRLRQGGAEQAVAVPMTFGALRPVVLLPQGIADWPAGRLRVVLLHEMAHVGRGDWTALILAQFVCALYWFHPLVWLAARRLRAEGEEACDDRVLTCGVPAPDYAAYLLEIVRALPSQNRVLPAAVTMAQSRKIAGRLKTILAHPKDRTGVTRRGLALATLAALLLVMPLAAMHPARRPAPAVVRNVAVLTNTPWTAKLSDGGLVKLVAVIGADRKGNALAAAWAPDGSPMAGSPAVAFEAPPGKGYLTALLSLLSEQNGIVALRLAVTPPKLYKAMVVSISGNRRGHLDIGLRVSAGPYTTLISSPLGQGASHRLPSGEMVTLSKGITGWQNGPLTGGRRLHLTQIKLTIPMRFNTPDYDSKLEALGADGRPVALTNYLDGFASGSGASRQLFYSFRPSDLKSRRVTGFQFVARPADHFTFHNVALQPNLPADAAHPAGPPPVSQIFDPLDKDPSVRDRARRQRIATALRLRKQRQGWAERNAVLLRRMRQAGPDDLAALLRVYAQVPPSINASAEDAAFTVLGAPSTLSHLRKSQEPLDVQHRQDFARYRDLRVSQSFNTGLTSITLWASGRVTETTLTGRVVGHTRMFAVDPKETADIAPPYPFLK